MKVRATISRAKTDLFRRQKLRILGGITFFSIISYDFLSKAVMAQDQIWKQNEKEASDTFDKFLPSTLDGFSDLFFDQGRIYLYIVGVMAIGNGFIQIARGGNAFETWAFLSFSVGIFCILIGVFNNFIFGTSFN